VINRLNMYEPPDYVRWLRARWPRLEGRVFSFMAPVAAALRNMDYMPRMSDALPPLRAALDDCLAAGEMVRVAGVCGLPLCVLRAYEDHCDEAANTPGIALSDDRTKLPGCVECKHVAKCSGVWRRYVERYGGEELVPVRD
jgi:hypothetical protein